MTRTTTCAHGQHYHCRGKVAMNTSRDFGKLATRYYDACSCECHHQQQETEDDR
jgi:hypothetical protein